ncbi:formate C-acetyltransferase [Candidatus Daviesbacteria bacterium]|nr:formate C-acetyltransferase [Candidatus Daviesbacteria bacterium]
MDKQGLPFATAKRRPFKKGKWEDSIDIRDFLYLNLTPYANKPDFLEGPSEKTKKLWRLCKILLEKEFQAGGVLDIDTETISTVISHKPGYIKKELELIVGLQTDQPLKRAAKPFGGIRVVEQACEDHGKTLAPKIKEIFEKFRKSHNDGIFDAYTQQMRKFRTSGVITGLPDNYARGRIIGDYRRVALYGVDRLIEEKQKDLNKLAGVMTDELTRLREEVSDQIKALDMLKEMALSYKFDISKPANNSREAIQWTYFAYLAALKEQDGAAMSLGNVSGFFDVYIEKDIKEGKLTESQAQELIDQFIIKLRLVRQLRMSEYDKIFAGDPTWLTESLAGMFLDGRTKVTRTTYRFLQSLYNLGPAPEPNLTVLWSERLPQDFKEFAAKVSIDTSSIQYENDDLMRDLAVCDDYGISCCVSQNISGSQMQFFGARCNLGKTLLLALNEGRDENSGVVLVEGIKPLKKDILDFDEVMEEFRKTLAEVARVYVDTVNIIHYMHDKYYYERAQMALLDTKLDRLMAFGVAGLSVVADSLSAIKYAKVKALRDKEGITKRFEIEGDFPKFGNDDDKVDQLAKELVDVFYKELKKHHIYRQASPTLSVLTITSNVMYGKKTGATPDGRLAGEPFAPGANPMHGRDSKGAIASLNSVAKLNYLHARDGISNTFSIVPRALGSTSKEQVENLVSLLDGYFQKKGHHLNVNVLNKDTLLKAMEHPQDYPQLTIRVSGYAVNFVKLSREHQQEVLARTFFESM